MFGSIANYLENSMSSYNDPFKIQPAALYRLVLSLERHTPDVISVLELVKMKKPLSSLGWYNLNHFTVTVNINISVLNSQLNFRFLLHG